MIYKIIRHDKESDDITVQAFKCYEETYDLLEDIYSDVCYPMLIMVTVPIMKSLK